MENMLEGLDIEDQEFLDEFNALVTAIKLMKIECNDVGWLPFKEVKIKIDDSSHIKFQIIYNGKKFICVTGKLVNSELKAVSSLFDGDHIKVVRVVRSWL